MAFQGAIIYPCGYPGGAKSRKSAPASFEEHEVSLSSQTGIAQIEKDKELQLTDESRCLDLSNILSEEAMDHVKKMCGPGYTMEGPKAIPIEPESEGSTIAKGPGYFIQPHTLPPGTGVEGFFGDGAKLAEDDVAYLCKVSFVSSVPHHHFGPFLAPNPQPSSPFIQTHNGRLFPNLPATRAFLQHVEDDQGEIKSACLNYFLQFFKAMDEDGKGVLVADAFKTVLGKLEEDMPMAAKSVCAWRKSQPFFLPATCSTN